MSGNTPCLKQFVKIILRGVTNETSLSFIILLEISSQPCSLLELSDLIIFSIFSSEMQKASIRVDFFGVSCGISLPVSMVVHWSMKWSLKSCAFSVNSVMNNPFSKRGGIMGILALFRTVLIKV